MLSLKAKQTSKKTSEITFFFGVNAMKKNE